LEDEYIVFNPLSDEIHRLNPIAATVLAELEAGPLSVEQLTTRLASVITIDMDDGLHSQIRGIIAQFDELGLVHPLQAIIQQP
jgi:PqqD family protein of HPr-rel-A system